MQTKAHTTMVDGMERQPGLFGAIFGILGVVVGSIDALETGLRLFVMLATGLAAIAGFLYNLEKWRKQRQERLAQLKTEDTKNEN